ncbi:MAG TPA: PASTA domain-containing protein, partial [Lacisediminihabitans sp.]|uniref:PASTA domain-containing protein n=1 Tax=Lacisediminihabitans sp. TaxID=2787631 RepID=UPI002ED93D78
ATMQYTHATGTVHGNLGPATVRLTGSDPLRPVVKVVDFGPQPAELLVPTDPELTAAMWQRFTRSLEYPSPEQKKAGAPTRRSDIFGFGCVLAALLLRIPESPLDGRDDPGTSDGPGGATAGVDIDVASELRAIATTAMKKNPVERQHSFLVVQEQLRWIRVARTLDRRPDAPTDTLTVPAIPDATSQNVTEEIRIRPRSAPLPVQRTKRKHPGATLVAVLAGLIVLVIGAVWLPAATVGRTASPPVTIPAVAGKDVAAASDLLAKAGLTVGGQRSQPDARVAAGLVAATDPAAGSQLPTDSAVTLLVSSGPDLGTVPQLIGLSISAAQDALTKSGLAAGAIRYRNGVSAAGVVLGSTPAFGERAPAGSAVALVVASGNQAVPAGLIGQAAEAAAAALTAAGFSPQIVTVARSDVAPGIVVDVAPGQGSVHPLGTVVTLMESRWASPSPSPTPGGPSTSPSPRSSEDPDD